MASRVLACDDGGVSESKRPDPQRRYARTERTRHQLIEAAVAHVAQRGLAGATIGEIADTVGISKGVIQYHFGNKTELVRALVDEVCSTSVSEIMAAAAHGDDPAAQVERFVKATLASRTNETAEARVLCQLGSIGLEDAEVGNIVRERLAADHVRMVKFLDEVLSKLGVPMLLPASTIVTMTLALADGLGMRKLIAPNAPDLGQDAIAALGRAVFAPR